jgi:2-phosphosulfolactate phosphatase
MRQLRAYFLPSLVRPEELAGTVAVVIDVLRATTTIVFALAAGAREVIPCLEVDEAQRIAAALPKGQAVLGGERGGMRIEGFHFGNSPEECAPLVCDKTVVFTTTNGTRAMDRCRSADETLLGAFVNRAALCERLARHDSVSLICSGTGGEITREDVLLAGAIVERLEAAGPWQLNDQARLAADGWRSVESSGVALAHALADTQGGRNLVELGLGKDIEAAAALDRFTLAPRLDAQRWRIVLAE